MGEDIRLIQLPGEGGSPFAPVQADVSEIVIKEKPLTFEEASQGLHTLGKDESGCRYAYIALSAVDRQLTEIAVVIKFKHVLFLDLSGNYLQTESLQILTELPFLILLKAERNRIESAGLNPMYYLQVLTLNQNQIKETGSLNQPMLDCLEMNHNDIYTPQFEKAHLESLKQLEMRSNLLFDISGVYPVTVEKLYLAANKINAINTEDFSKLVNLKLLHLRQNHLQKLDGFSASLKNLRYLNLRSNKISKFKEFRKLQCLPNLETLIVTGNPLPGAQEDAAKPTDTEGPDEEEVEGEGGAGRKKDIVVLSLLVLLPNLKRINKTVITIEDRIDAEDMENDILDGILEDDATSAEETDLGATTTDMTGDKTESENEL